MHAPSPKAAPAARRRAAGRAGAALCRPLCDDARQAALPISRASCANAAGTARASRRSRGAGRADGRARLCRRRGLRAVARRASLTGRGYGERRVGQALRAAGIDEDGCGRARASWRQAEPGDAALRFAERRRIGPFAAATPIARQREKALAAMVRAGHPFRACARRLRDWTPGAKIRIWTIFANLR